MEDRSAKTYDPRVLNPQRLLVLQAVVSAGSVNAAAKNLNYAPATISQHLKVLASETGLVLFEKDGRNIAPTSAALLLLEHATPVLADLERLSRAVSDLRDGQADHLAIACFSSAAQAWVPQVATVVRERYPATTIEISLNEPHDGRGRRPPDLIVNNEPVTGPARILDNYRRHELLTEPFSVVMSPTHRLAMRDEVPMSELRDEAWIDHDIYDSPTGQIIRTACSAAGFSAHYSARLDDHHAALTLVAAGLGVTVLPRLALTALPSGLTVRPLVRPAVHRRIVAHARVHPRRHQIIDTALAGLRHAAAGSTP